jgi:hypothetical protein
MNDGTFLRIPAVYKEEGQEWEPSATTISERYGPQGWEAANGEPLEVEGVPGSFEWVLRRAEPSGEPRLHG